MMCGWQFVSETDLLKTSSYNNLLSDFIFFSPDKNSENSLKKKKEYTFEIQQTLNIFISPFPFFFSGSLPWAE